MFFFLLVGPRDVTVTPETAFSVCGLCRHIQVTTTMRPTVRTLCLNTTKKYKLFLVSFHKTFSDFLRNPYRYTIPEFIYFLYSLSSFSSKVIKNNGFVVVDNISQRIYLSLMPLRDKICGRKPLCEVFIIKNAFMKTRWAVLKVNLRIILHSFILNSR